MAKSRPRSRSRKGSRKSCGPGKIRRASYHRKGYRRASGSQVSATYVPSACVKDMGKPGKTSKAARVLPEPGHKLSLSKYGYGVDRPAAERHAALRKAAEQEGPLAALRRLNLLANYQAVPENKKLMREDVKYMSKFYAQTKREASRSKSRSSRKSRKSRGSRKSRKSRRLSRSRSRKGSKKSSKRSKRRSRRLSRSRSRSRKGSKKSSKKRSKRRSRK